MHQIPDLNLSDSQVGARKGKIVRNQIWNLNGVICDVLSSKRKTPVDYRQCFDSMFSGEMHE